MKYKLFPRLDFFAYLKKIHVSYHPGREKTEVARYADFLRLRISPVMSIVVHCRGDPYDEDGVEMGHIFIFEVEKKYQMILASA